MSVLPILTPDARALAHQNGLSGLGQEALDGNYDGKIDAHEVEAVVRVADIDRNGRIEPKERRQLSKLLGGERHDADLRMDEEYLQSGMRGHSAQTLRDAQREVDAAREKFDRAKRNLPAGERPKQTAEELRSAQSALRSRLEGLEAAHEKASTELATLGKQLPEAQARLERAKSALEHPSVALHGMSASYGKEADTLERLGRLVPTMDALPKAIRDLKTQIRADEQLLSSQQSELHAATGHTRTLEARIQETKLRLTQAESDLSRLEATQRMEQLPKSEGATIGPATARFHPSTVKERVIELRRLAGRDDSNAPARTRAERELSDATREKNTLEKGCAEARATLRRLETELPRTREELAQTERTLARREAFDAHDDAQSRYDRALGQRRVIENLAGTAEQGESWRRADLDRVSRTKVVMSEAERAIGRLETPGARQITRELATLQQVEHGLYDGKLNARQVDITRVEADIERRLAALEPDTKDLVKASEALIEESRDPVFRSSLGRMPHSEQAETLERMTKVLVRTEAGRKMIETDVVPALRGDAGADPFWSSIVGPERTGRGLDQRAMAVLDGVAPVVAHSKDGGRLLDDGMARALTVDARQMTQLEEAVRLKNEGDRRGADALLVRHGMSHLVPELDRISTSLLGKELALTMAEISADGRLRLAFAGPANVTSKIQLAEKITSESTRFGRFARLCGKVTPPLNVVAGALGLNSAIDYGDVGGTVGNSLITTGGVTAGVGLALSTTVVGAPAGLICKGAGAIIAGVGYGIDLIWGDSRTQKTLKSMGLSGYLR